MQRGLSAIAELLVDKYLRNQKRSDQGSFGKSVRLDMIHKEPPITGRGGGGIARYRNKSSVFVSPTRYQFPCIYSLATTSVR